MTPRSGAPAPLDPDLVADLSRASAHPRDPSARRGVQHVQTHLSHVFLTAERVYKLRKAVDLGFVDFTTREERNADCLREIHLNRRLSPDVYLGVAAVTRAGGGRGTRNRVGPLRETLAPPGRAEHVVVMRRLPKGRDARSLLAAGRLRAAQLDAVAELVARFHRRSRAERPLRIDRATWLARVAAPVRANFESLGPALGAGGAARGAFPPARLARLSAATEAWLAAHADRLEARRRAGRGVDGHGDLHLEHVWFEREDAPPLLVDCIEFRDDFREIDAASEVAFLAMDLAYRGARHLAARFLAAYAAQADDFDLFSAVDFFIAYRAAVRAKVAAVAAGDAAIAPSQRAAARASVRRHLALAERALAPRRGGALVLTCGAVGTGKSSVARALADALDGVVIASDRVRKGPGLALRAGYDEAAKEAVYEALLERAAPVVASGRLAVLDATYDLARRRKAALAFAAGQGVPAFLVETRCAARVARRRLAARRRAGGDPSDAGPELHAWSVRRLERPDEWPRARRYVVRTDTPWRRSAREIARRISHVLRASRGTPAPRSSAPPRARRTSS
ncbi:MAG TPA: AAA family ATPase [Myxococcota bacterium]|nr:AAA family ATPase [Myxococcota bacterium]